MSAVVAGGGPLAGIPSVYGHDVSSAESLATVGELLRGPINAIDTANEYGGGEGERRIGTALRLAGAAAEGFVVMTKADPVGRDYSAARVRRSLAESRERLGIDYLPVVHLHDPELFAFDEVTGRGGALEALLQEREAGRIGAVGLAGGPVQEMRRYLALRVFDVLLVHNRWTLVDRSAGELIDEAVDMGVGVLNAAVFGGGALARPGDIGTYAYRTIRPETASSIQAMQAVCARHGTDLRTAALQFSLHDERVSATVVGMGRRQSVHDTLAMAATVLPSGLWDELESLVPPRDTWLDGRS